MQHYLMPCNTTSCHAHCFMPCNTASCLMHLPCGPMPHAICSAALYILHSPLGAGSALLCTLHVLQVDADDAGCHSEGCIQDGTVRQCPAPTPRYLIPPRDPLNSIPAPQSAPLYPLPSSRRHPDWVSIMIRREGHWEMTNPLRELPKLAGVRHAPPLKRGGVFLDIGVF